MSELKLAWLTALAVFAAIVGIYGYNNWFDPAKSGSAQNAQLQLRADPKDLTGTSWTATLNGPDAPGNYRTGGTFILTLESAAPNGVVEGTMNNPKLHFSRENSSFNGAHIHLTPNVEDIVNLDADLTNVQATEMSGVYHYKGGSVPFSAKRK